MAVLRQILYRRAILIYFLAIVVPALVLLYLGLLSLQRQQEAIQTLQASNLRLSGEKLAAQLGRRTTELARACLEDAQSGPIFAARLEEVLQRHPIARHFFVLEGDAVSYPRLRTLPPVSPNRAPAEFSKAEALELRSARPDLALAGYQRTLELPVPDSVKALALSRVARCLDKLKQREEAAQAWRTLLEKFGNLYDPSHRPYALVAALQLGQGERVYADFVRGRWELSAEQIDYFLERLQGTGPVPETEYLARFRFGRALEENFHHYGPLRTGEIHAHGFEDGGIEYRTYYTLAFETGGQETLLGFAVNRKWVDEELLPQCRLALGMTEEIRPIRAGDTLFEPLTAGPGRGLLIYGGATILVLCVLVMGVLLLVRDVTREMRMNELRAEFVSGVSHELKTPLTLIRLYGDTLLEGGDFAEDERRGFYQIITRESERLTHLIEKVLTFSRIERGEKQYRLQDGDLAPVIARTVEVYGHYLERRGFSVESQLSKKLPLVRFDPDGVSQAVVNLLDNAVKYSGDSKFVGVRLRAADGKVIFEVEDRGIGIPPSEQQKIFERFYRGPNSAAKGGYGLGLFLVKHIMEAHSGGVEVDSEPGRGSRFRLIFPVPA